MEDCLEHKKLNISYCDKCQPDTYITCPKHAYENRIMAESKKLYDDKNWSEIQRQKDAAYYKGKKGAELRDNEYYDWSQTIEENYSRKEIIPNTDEVDIDWEEIISLQKRMGSSQTQMEEKMYKARIEEQRMKLVPITKQVLTVLQNGIWALHMQGMGVNEIAKQYGVSHQNISQQIESIVKKLTKHVRNYK
jgi:DNA-directed RNA polymerase specialized sigma subunit